MLSSRQPWIERNLTNRHLNQGTLILYDVTSTYLEGKQCALAAFGHNRDAKRGKMQIVYGVLCPAEDYPVAVEVISGNNADLRTLDLAVRRIRENLQSAGLDFGTMQRRTPKTAAGARKRRCQSATAAR